VSGLGMVHVQQNALMLAAPAQLAADGRPLAVLEEAIRGDKAADQPCGSRGPVRLRHSELRIAPSAAMTEGGLCIR
jgi:hypothetical protein